jgi:SAM-dependent methyltransferase
MKTKLIKDRFVIIKKYVTGKDVLDVGCAGCPYNPKKVPFDIIKANAKSYWGLDIRKSKDPKILHGDAETTNLNKKFDVIVAGDIIEHLSNQGLFLENMKKHLRPGGKLIISTPNIRSRWIFSPTNPEHVLWHSKQTFLQLFKRHNYQVVEFYYYFGNKKLFFLFELFKEIFYRLIRPMTESMMIIIEDKK